MVISLSTGRSLKLHFLHSSHNFDTRKDAGSMRIALDADAREFGRRLTLCEVSEVNTVDGESTYTTLGAGVAICHPNDTFQKTVGRKLSLAKALSAALPSGANDDTLSEGQIAANYQDRDEVWAAYHDLFGRD
jgi:hypothetical protein